MSIMTKILIEVEGPLHKALKIRAIEKGVSMAEAVIEGIKWYVRSNSEETPEATVKKYLTVQKEGESENAF